MPTALVTALVNVGSIAVPTYDISHSQFLRRNAKMQFQLNLIIKVCARCSGICEKKMLPNYTK